VIADAELLAVVHRVKRGTTNRDVLVVCEELEKRLLMRPVSLTGGKGNNVSLTAVGGFDRKAYQRELMRKRRAKLK
jgi:hypothetical protein